MDKLYLSWNEFFMAYSQVMISLLSAVGLFTLIAWIVKKFD